MSVRPRPGLQPAGWQTRARSCPRLTPLVSPLVPRVGPGPTLLLLDRSFDCMTPLLHEYTYQAMVNDLLHVQDERYKYSYTGNNNQTLSKEVLLNDTDPLYKQLKHMHIAELSTRFETQLLRPIL